VNQSRAPLLELRARWNLPCPVQLKLVDRMRHRRCTRFMWRHPYLDRGRLRWTVWLTHDEPDGHVVWSAPGVATHPYACVKETLREIATLNIRRELHLAITQKGSAR
jgi:delta-aminolevulinic acid dehydratase/porphobilinogen synthase